MLLIPEDSLTSAAKAGSEEFCLCDQSWHFGCVIVLGINFSPDWSQDSNLLAHEVGHTLGAGRHDDDLGYGEEDEYRFLMWSAVSDSVETQAA